MNNTPQQSVNLCNSRTPEHSISEANVNTPPPPAPTHTVRAKLKSIGDVSHELAKLYREARGGKLDVSDASKLAHILALLGRILEGAQLEARVEALEQRGMH